MRLNKERLIAVMTSAMLYKAGDLNYDVLEEMATQIIDKLPLIIRK